MRLLPPPLPIRKAAEATEASRDRLIDTVRAFSLLTVVTGHAFMAIVVWRDGVPEVGNVLASSPRLQLITWLLQVMPLFFFAGGASNTISWRRGRERGYGSWLWGRAARLLRPLWCYLAVMAPTAIIVGMFAPAKTSAPLLLLTTQLLWFLGAYLTVTALGPWLIARHEQHPWMTLALLVSLSALVDLARFAWHAPAATGLVNFVAVWAVGALLGSWYVDGKLSGLRAALFAAAGLGANFVLTTVGPYPLSMVGMPGEPISNMAPPTTALLAHSFWLCGAVGVAAPLIRKLSQIVSVWRVVVGVNLSAMTVYLWHLPVLIGLSVLEKLAGRPAPARPGASALIGPGSGYWVWWLAHYGIFVVGVLGAVRLFWVLENISLPVWDSPTCLPRPGVVLQRVSAGAGVGACGISLLMFAATGLAGFPVRVVQYAGLPLSSGLAVTVLVSGALLVRFSGADRKKA